MNCFFNVFCAILVLMPCDVFYDISDQVRKFICVDVLNWLNCKFFVMFTTNLILFSAHVFSEVYRILLARCSALRIMRLWITFLPHHSLITHPTSFKVPNSRRCDRVTG